MDPKRITNDFNSVFERFETLLRYIAPGFVAVLVAITVGPDEWVMGTPKQITDNFWGYFVIATVIGFLLYTMNTALLISWLWPWIVWIRLNGHRSKLSVLNGDNSRRANAYFELDKQRWMRRASRSERVRTIQQQITRWSSNNHFLYCSSLSFVLIPLITILIHQGGYRRDDFQIYSIILGTLLLWGAITSDYRNCRMEIWASEKFPEGKDVSVKNAVPSELAPDDSK